MHTNTRSRSRSDVGRKEQDGRRPPPTYRSSHRISDDRASRSSRSASDERRDYRNGRNARGREDSADSRNKRAPARHHQSSEAGKREQNFNQRAASRSLSPALETSLLTQKPLLVDNPGDFKNFPELSAATVKGLTDRGITSLFPVQYLTFRRILNREDIMVRDLTGSGKTLGFCLPMVEIFRRERLFGKGKPLAMILAPTRELALQISKELEMLKHNPREYNVLTVYGGVDIYGQTNELRRGVDIFVGTTGRIKDHMERKNFDFSSLRFAVLDEADIMLNLGFKEDVEHIMGTIKAAGPRDLQAMMFSATIPSWVRQIASMFLKPNYQLLDLVANLKNKTSKTVAHLAINVPYYNRVSALADILICYGGTGQTIVFTSTKAEANQLLLSDKIKKDIEVMHGDIAQNQREVTLKRFKEKKFSVLVATDVASRGLDIPSVDLVIQVEPPKDAETYIHRSGRTARAGRSGTCITFYNLKQKYLIQQIEFKAGITFQKIGVPQPEQVIRATSKGTIESLKEVNEKVIPLFEEAAEMLIAHHKGDMKKALCQTLALLSGHHKEEMVERSLLTGQENCVTFQITMEKPFYAVSLVWNILRRYLPEAMTSQIRGMRCFTDMTGACFDVMGSDAQRLEDILGHETVQKNVDFKFQRALTLPELKEDQYAGSVQPQGGRFGGQQSYGGRGSYGGQGNGNSGYGQNGSRPSYNSGGQQQRFGEQRDSNRGAPQGGRSDNANSVFVGNLGDADERQTEDILRSLGINPLRIRVMKDETGRPKGAAFVDFRDSNETEAACKQDGQAAPVSGRRLRINPANQRPSR